MVPAREGKCRMTLIEHTLLRCLASQGPIRGTAQVGYALWPDRPMQPQGAALAAGKNPARPSRQRVRGQLQRKYVVALRNNESRQHYARCSAVREYNRWA